MSVNENTEPALLADHAMQALGILQQPFDASNKDFNYYCDENIQLTLDGFLAALDNPNNIPIIVGSSGSGKTAIFSLLIEQTSESVQYFLVDGNDNFSAFNVFSGMLEAFQEPAPDDFQICLDRLVTRLRSLEEQSLRAVVLIDDAHLVSTTELYQLISAMLYMQNGAALDSFRIAFTATSGFENHNTKIVPAGSNLKFHISTPPRFDQNASNHYIEHRLYQAGYFEPQPLDRRQLDKIHHLAQGIPGAINQQSVSVLNTFLSTPLSKVNYTPEKSRFGGNFALGALAIVLVAISGWLFQFSGKPNSQKEPVVITKEPLPDYSNTDEPPRLVLLSEVESSQLSKDIPKTLVLLGDTPEPPTAIKLVDKNSRLPDPVVKTDIEQAKSIIKTKPVEKKPKPAIKAKKVAAESKKAPRKPIKNPIVNATKVGTKEKSVDNVAQDPEKNNPKKETEIANQTVADASYSLQSPNWVLMQNPEQFTVQMIASSSRKEVERFLSLTDLPEPNSIFSFNRANETWYALVHGLFLDVDDAKSAIKSLPKKVRANHPWIRQIRRIHDSIRDNERSDLG